MTTRDPLVDADVDLSDFPFMPVTIARLKQSRAWLICKRKPALAFYMLNLWMASWHGRPAASLEDDDLVLADVAMCDERTWAKVKTDVLRGWVRCDDGRLYHPVVAEHAAEAWARKTARRNQTEAARVAKELSKLKKLEAERVETERLSALRGGRTDRSTGSVTGNETRPVTDDATGFVSTSKGQGQGQGQGKEEDVWVGVRERVSEAFIAAGNINPPDTSWVDLWRARGHDPEICLAVVKSCLERNNTIRALKWFDQAIADAHSAPQGRARAGPNPRSAKPSHLSVLQEDFGHGPASRHFRPDEPSASSAPERRQGHHRGVPESADRERRESLAAERRAERLPAFVDDREDG